MNINDFKIFRIFKWCLFYFLKPIINFEYKIWKIFAKQKRIKRFFSTTGNISLVNALAIIQEIGDFDKFEDYLFIDTGKGRQEFVEKQMEIANLHRFKKIYVGYQTNPGITAVLAESNTLPSIFAALKARRCYSFMGGRMWIDFRINGHYMGEEFKGGKERSIYINVKADTKIKKITLVKNCRDYIIMTRAEQLIFDYKAEKRTDVYYLRVELEDGRCGWTSPIWIKR